MKVRNELFLVGSLFLFLLIGVKDVAAQWTCMDSVRVDQMVCMGDWGYNSGNCSNEGGPPNRLFPDTVAYCDVKGPGVCQTSYGVCSSNDTCRTVNGNCACSYSVAQCWACNAPCVRNGSQCVCNATPTPTPTPTPVPPGPTPPPQARYRCSGNSCIRDDAGGGYTDANCNGACAAPPRPGCNVVTISVSPGTSNVGQGLNFSLSGDASTNVEDYIDGVNAPNSSAVTGITSDAGARAWGFSGTANGTGSHTWERKWTHCEGNINNCSPFCSTTASFTISPRSIPPNCNTPPSWNGYGIDTYWDNGSSQYYDPTRVAQYYCQNFCSSPGTNGPTTYTNNANGSTWVRTGNVREWWGSWSQIMNLNCIQPTPTPAPCISTYSPYGSGIEFFHPTQPVSFRFFPSSGRWLFDQATGVEAVNGTGMYYDPGRVDITYRYSGTVYTICVTLPPVPTPTPTPTPASSSGRTTVDDQLMGAIVDTTGATTHRLKLEATTAAGQAAITGMNIDINSQSDQNLSRGSVVWKPTIAFGGQGTWITCNPGSGFMYVNRPQEWAGNAYTNFIGCSNTIINANRRDFVVTVRFNSNYTTPTGPNANTLIGAFTVNNIGSGSIYTSKFSIPSAAVVSRWWQASGGDVFAAGGNITSKVPDTKYLIDGTAAGVAGATGSVTATPGAVSTAPSWQVTGNSILSTRLKERYGYEAMKQRIRSQVNIPEYSFNNVSEDYLKNTATLDNGVRYLYVKDYDLSIPVLNLGTTKVVIIADKKVIINGNITFDEANGGLFVVLAGGNIEIDSAVGGPATSPSLQGIYFAQGTVKTGTGAGKQLRIDGTVVGIGGVTLERDLASAEPGEIFNYRPKMMLNLPKTLLKQNNVWQEVAP